MLSERFLQLDRLLDNSRAWWHYFPFHQQSNPFEAIAPELVQRLNACDEAQLSILEENPQQLHTLLSDVIPNIAAIPELIDFPKALAPPLPLPKHGFEGIPGRKAEQIAAFAAIIPQGDHYIEWCSGKGYLGRLLAQQHNKSVTSLEYQEQLCLEGEMQAQKSALSQRFICTDVFTPEAKKLIDRESHLFALHACGDLHVELIKAGVAARAPSITISPCCYQLIRSDHYQPLSTLAKQSPLQLSKAMLAMAVQESVTAGSRVRRLRQIEVRWRLGFDALQRHLTGSEHYLPLPSTQKALFSKDFAHFCRWAAEQKSISLPTQLNYAHWEEMGAQRFQQVRRQELVRSLFRRPLEVWLLLDRALFLEEQNYRVTLSTFCPRETTPRNLLLQAKREK